MLDPLGLALENFDGVGRYRRKAGDRDIDPRGQVLGTSDIDGPVADADELVGRLARSADVKACMATQWWQFALGREDLPARACWRQTAYDRFAASGFNLRELVLAIAESRALGW
jgi:hypothetical protein